MEKEFIPAKNAMRELMIWAVAEKENFQEQKKTEVENRKNAASQAVKEQSWFLKVINHPYRNLIMSNNAGFRLKENIHVT